MLQVYFMKLDFSIYIRDIYLIWIWKYKFLKLFLYNNNTVKKHQTFSFMKAGWFQYIFIPRLQKSDWQYRIFSNLMPTLFTVLEG